MRATVEIGQGEVRGLERGQRLRPLGGADTEIGGALVGVARQGAARRLGLLGERGALSLADRGHAPAIDDREGRHSGPPSRADTATSTLQSRAIVGLMTISSMTVRGGKVAQSSTARATSSGCIIVDRALSSGTRGRRDRMGVSTSPGRIVVARIPLARRTLWTCPIRVRTPALAAPYGAPPISPGRSAAPDDTVTIVPPPRSIMSGNTAWVSV